MLKRIGLPKRRAPSLIVSLCSPSLMLSPGQAAGQDVALLTFGDGGGKSDGTDFQIETIIGQTFVDRSAGPTQSADFGFWFAEFALIDPSAVSNESTALPDGTWCASRIGYGSSLASRAASLLVCSPAAARRLSI